MFSSMLFLATYLNRKARGSIHWKVKLEIEIENWNGKLKLKIEIENWNWKLKLKIEIKNKNWKLKSRIKIDIWNL